MFKLFCQSTMCHEKTCAKVSIVRLFWTLLIFVLKTIVDNVILSDQNVITWIDECLFWFRNRFRSNCIQKDDFHRTFPTEWIFWFNSCNRLFPFFQNFLLVFGSVHSILMDIMRSLHCTCNVKLANPHEKPVVLGFFSFL